MFNTVSLFKSPVAFKPKGNNIEVKSPFVPSQGDTLALSFCGRVENSGYSNPEEKLADLLSKNMSDLNNYYPDVLAANLDSILKDKECLELLNKTLSLSDPSSIYKNVEGMAVKKAAISDVANLVSPAMLKGLSDLHGFKPKNAMSNYLLGFLTRALTAAWGEIDSKPVNNNESTQKRSDAEELLADFVAKNMKNSDNNDPDVLADKFNNILKEREYAEALNRITISSNYPELQDTWARIARMAIDKAAVSDESELIPAKEIDKFRLDKLKNVRGGNLLAVFLSALDTARKKIELESAKNYANVSESELQASEEKIAGLFAQNMSSLENYDSDLFADKFNKAMKQEEYLEAFRKIINSSDLRKESERIAQMAVKKAAISDESKLVSPMMMEGIINYGRLNDRLDHPLTGDLLRFYLDALNAAKRKLRSDEKNY